MTEQHPEVSRASSFLHGASAGYVERFQARFAADPETVDEARPVRGSSAS